VRAKRRNDGVPEEALEALVAAIDAGQRLRSGVVADAADTAVEAAELARCAEEEAAAAAATAAGAAAAPGAALPGRSTGSLEWRAARGELGPGANAGAGAGMGADGGAACASAPEALQGALKRLVHAHFALLTTGCGAAAGACAHADCAKGPQGPAKSANEAAVRALALARKGAVIH
jgi:hypothetical protein